MHVKLCYQFEIKKDFRWWCALTSSNGPDGGRGGTLRGEDDGSARSAHAEVEKDGERILQEHQGAGKLQKLL